MKNNKIYDPFTILFEREPNYVNDDGWFFKAIDGLLSDLKIFVVKFYFNGGSSRFQEGDALQACGGFLRRVIAILWDFECQLPWLGWNLDNISSSQQDSLSSSQLIRWLNLNPTMANPKP